MLTDLLSTWQGLPVLETYDTDFTDDLHRTITFTLLLVFGTLSSFKMFGTPMECLEPEPAPHSSFQAYTENYCWAQDTYFLPFDENIPRDVGERENKRISYYQWVPFFLLIVAACFRLPSLIWKYLAHHSGIKIHDIVKLAVDPKNIEPAVRKANIASLTIHLQNALRFHRRVHRKQVKPHKIFRILNIPYSAFFVTTMYLITKLAYIINVAVQLYMMNWFLETDKYTWYGFGALKDLINGTEWEQSGVFPRVSLCDFQVRVMGNVQRYSVQCVLVINIFNEKIFIFLWFWYALLLLLTSMSFIYWLFISVLPCPKMNFVQRHLELSDMPFDSDGSREEVDRFVNRYLKLDGVFVLRMITMHSGVIFGTDLVLSLWKAFYGIEDHYRRSNTTDNRTVGGGGVTPTPPVMAGGVDQNRANFLRQRKVLSGKSGTGDDDAKGGDSLTKQLLPLDYVDTPATVQATTTFARVELPPPKPPPKPTAPLSSFRQLPDSRNPHIGQSKQDETFDETGYRSNY